MVRRKLAAAACLAALACSAAQAETAAPRAGTMGLPAGKDTLFSALALWLDGVADRPERLRSRHAAAGQQEFAGPYALLVSGADEGSTTPMVLASLGLMALIAHRRRSLEP